MSHRNYMTEHALISEIRYEQNRIIEAKERCIRYRGLERTVRKETQRINTAHERIKACCNVLKSRGFTDIDSMIVTSEEKIEKFAIKGQAAVGPLLVIKECEVENVFDFKIGGGFWVVNGVVTDIPSNQPFELKPEHKDAEITLTPMIAIKDKS